MNRHAPPPPVTACCPDPNPAYPQRGKAICVTCGATLTPPQARAYECPHPTPLRPGATCPACGLTPKG